MLYMALDSSSVYTGLLLIPLMTPTSQDDCSVDSFEEVTWHLNDRILPACNSLGKTNIIIGADNHGWA